MDDAQIDVWNDGVIDALRGKAPRGPGEPAYMEGYRYGIEARKVRPVMPVRPEGYYHVNPNGEV
jgi:hypothetical protein